MLDVPRVIYRFPFLRLEAYNARFKDVYYPVRALPRRRELVSPLGTLFPPKNPISDLKLPGSHPPAVIMAQPLLILGCPYHCLATCFLQKVDVIDPFLLL